MKTLFLFLMLTAATMADDFVIGVSRPANNIAKVPLTISNAPFHVVDFSLKNDRLNEDWRDYVGHDEQGRKIREPRGPEPMAGFPVLIDCDSGCVVPWTTLAASTNAMAAAIAASDFGQARSNLNAVLVGRDEAVARKEIRQAIKSAFTGAQQKALLDLADFLLAKDQASGGGLRKKAK